MIHTRIEQREGGVDQPASVRQLRTCLMKESEVQMDAEQFRERWETDKGIDIKRRIVEFLQYNRSRDAIPPGFDADASRGIADMQGIDLRDLDLSGCILIAVNLNYAVFDRSVLNKSIFNSSSLVNASFVGVAGKCMQMTGVVARSACFDYADLRNSVLVSSWFEDASFCHSDLSDADLSWSHYAGAKFDGAVTHRIDLYQAKGFQR